MRLSDEQLNNLILLVTPKFDDLQVRKAALAQAFPDNSGSVDVTGFDQVSSRDFATALITDLAHKQTRNGSGELVLVAVLTSMQIANQFRDTAFVANVQPYINSLRSSSLFEQYVPASRGISITASSVSSVSAQAATRSPAFPSAPAIVLPPIGTTTHHHTGRRRRKRSALERFQDTIGRRIKLPALMAVVLVVLVLPAALVLISAADASARVVESYNSLRRVLTTVSSHNIAELTKPDLDRLQYSLDDMLEQSPKGTGPDAAAALRIRLSRRCQGIAWPAGRGNRTHKGRGRHAPGVAADAGLCLAGNAETRRWPQLSRFHAGDRIVELLRIGQDRFTSADTNLALAQEKLAAIDLSNLPSNYLLTVQDSTRSSRRIFRTSMIFWWACRICSLKAFGLDDNANYLILSANSDELRPSGGYISTYGWLSVRGFRVADYGYGATSLTSPNPPPDTFVNQLKIPAWWSQYVPYPHPIYMAFDGSWSPDFPTTAKMAAWFYDNGKNPRSPVNGVIGIDLVGFENILKVLGTVIVPGYSQPVNVSNLRSLMYQISDDPRKDFTSAIYNQLLSQWQSLTPEQDSQLFTAVLQGLSEKHIMIYYLDDKIDQAVHLLGWDGAQMPGTTNDYLMFADTNMGSKSNRSIQRQITYDVDIAADGTLNSRATVAYDYSTQLAAQDPGVTNKVYNDINYFNLLQVYTPAHSTLTSTKNLQTKARYRSEQRSYRLYHDDAHRLRQHGPLPVPVHHAVAGRGLRAVQTLSAAAAKTAGNAWRDSEYHGHVATRR